MIATLAPEILYNTNVTFNAVDMQYILYINQVKSTTTTTFANIMPFCLIWKFTRQDEGRQTVIIILFLTFTNITTIPIPKC